MRGPLRLTFYLGDRSFPTLMYKAYADDLISHIIGNILPCPMLLYAGATLIILLMVVVCRAVDAC